MPDRSSFSSVFYKALILIAITFFCAVAQEKGELNETKFSLSAVIEHFSKKMEKIIVPDDGLLTQLKNKTPVIVMPPNLDKLRFDNPGTWEDILSKLLSIYGYTLIDKGDYFRLVSVKDSEKDNLPFFKTLNEAELRSTSERIITQVIVLKNAQVDDVRPIFKYVSSISPPLTLMDKRTMIVIDKESNLKYFLELVSLIDKPKEATYTKIYELQRITASKFRGQLQTYLNGLRSRDKGAQDVALTPILLDDDNTNRLIVSAIRSDHQVVEDFIDFFDKPVKEERKFRPIEIYRLKNSDAKIVAEKLDKILKAKSSPGASGAPKPKGEEDIPTIVPFEELNALIISVERPETFKAVKEVIELIDIKRKQVFISSTIVEVNNTKSFNFGVDVGFQANPNGHTVGVLGGTNNGTAALSLNPSNANRPVSLAPDAAKHGLNVAVPYKSWDMIPLVLTMAETDDNINVLATPSIVCDDNEDAQIDITEERSFNTTQTPVGGQPIVSQGGFNEAGIVLRITPSISSDQFLRLKIEQNVDRFIPSTDGRDTRLKRKATTTVTIPDRTTVVIGGLTQRQNSDGTSGVPFFSKIPVLGYLFKHLSSARSNNTLYFFITPKIINEFEQLPSLSNYYHERIGKSANKEMKGDELFIESKNHNVPSDAMRLILDPLYAGFDVSNLERWVLPGQHLELAKVIIAHRNEKDKTLFPSYTKPFFDIDKLDDVFVNLLDSSQKKINALPVEEQQDLVAIFNLYLVGMLEKVHKQNSDNDQGAGQ